MNLRQFQAKVCAYTLHHTEIENLVLLGSIRLRYELLNINEISCMCRSLIKMPDLLGMQ